MTDTLQILNCQALFTKVVNNFYVANPINDVFATCLATDFEVTDWLYKVANI